MTEDLERRHSKALDMLRAVEAQRNDAQRAGMGFAAKLRDVRAVLEEIDRIHPLDFKGIPSLGSVLDRIRAVLDTSQSAAVGPRPHREELGHRIREVWVRWAREQADPKPSWLLPWEDLDDGQREVDMRMGEALFALGMTWSPVPVSETEWTSVGEIAGFLSTIMNTEKARGAAEFLNRGYLLTRREVQP